MAQANPSSQPQAEPIEKKHLADDATGKQEPSANPERPPQHQPGFEAKHQKEAAKDDPNKRHKQGSQADEATAANQARDDIDAEETKKGQRARTARAKQHVRRMAPKPTRRHK